MTAEEKIKQDILKYIDDMEIDIEELDSYEYHSPTYSWESSCPEDSYEEYDEEEAFQAKVEKIIDSIENGFYHLDDYVDMTEEEAEDEELQLRLLNWLKSLID